MAFCWFLHQVMTHQLWRLLLLILYFSAQLLFLLFDYFNAKNCSNLEKPKVITNMTDKHHQSLCSCNNYCHQLRDKKHWMYFPSIEQLPLCYQLDNHFGFDQAQRRDTHKTLHIWNPKQLRKRKILINKVGFIWFGWKNREKKSKESKLLYISYTIYNSRSWEKVSSYN